LKCKINGGPAGDGQAHDSYALKRRGFPQQIAKFKDL
jgi:hypothetical protein